MQILYLYREQTPKDHWVHIISFLQPEREQNVNYHYKVLGYKNKLVSSIEILNLDRHKANEMWRGFLSHSKLRKIKADELLLIMEGTSLKLKRRQIMPWDTDAIYKAYLKVGEF